MILPDIVKRRGTLHLPREIADLYQPYLWKTTFFYDSTPIRPGVNMNQLEAEWEIEQKIRIADNEGRGLAIGLFGPMGAGKSTTICLLRELRPEESIGVWKHELDLARTGELLVNHTGDLCTKAELYGSVVQVEGLTRIVVLDEFQFNSQDNRARIEDFLERRRRVGLHTVFSQLDLDFRRERWATTEMLVPLVDCVIVLGARCSCGGHAEFTQRRVDGKPASMTDPVVVVGAEELYCAACGNCHKVIGKPSSYYVPC